MTFINVAKLDVTGEASLAAIQSTAFHVQRNAEKFHGIVSISLISPSLHVIHCTSSIFSPCDALWVFFSLGVVKEFSVDDKASFSFLPCPSFLMLSIFLVC